MNAGMLWYDNDTKTTLTAKIERAVDYYIKKYGHEPNLCLVHPNVLEKQGPSTAPAKASSAQRVKVRPYRPVLPGHLWIGVEDSVTLDQASGLTGGTSKN